MRQLLGQNMIKYPKADCTVRYWYKRFSGLVPKADS